jgi:uncharacterized protein
VAAANIACKFVWLKRRSEHTRVMEADAMPDREEVTPGVHVNNSDPPLRKRGPKRGTEEAKAGGNAVKEKYGSEYYSQLGRRGGARMRELYGADHYQRIGKKGGMATRERLGVEHYRRAGHKGGTAKRQRAHEQEQGGGRDPAVS